VLLSTLVLASCTDKKRKEEVEVESKA